PGAVVRGASAGAVRFARDTSRRVGQEIRRRRGHRHAIAPGRLPRRFASRLPRAVASGSGIRIDERSRLRRAGRCESARRPDAGAPAHPSAAGEAQGSCRDHGGSRDPGLGPGRGDHRPSAAGLGPAPMKPWHFGVLWLEVFEKSNWPEPLTGRVLSIGGHKTRKWKVLAKAHRRGRFRLGPIVLRSGDPFGLFATEARIPSEALLLVYPRVVQLPFWTLPGSLLEGNVLTGQRSLQSTSMVMGIREYRPGDAMNRIHWPSSVRHRRLHVKEFELDRTADLWIYLDLDGRWHHGDGEDSTEERAVTVAASVVRKALDGHRNVGLVTNGNRAEVLHPDRGTKQFGKLMQYLAEVHAGGTRSLQETLVETLPRLRRGASCLLITPSLDRAWVRPASSLRETAIAT